MFSQMRYPNFTRESQVFRSTFDRLPYGCLLFLYRLDLTHVKEMRRVGLDGGKRTHVFFIIITKHAPGVTFNSHPQSTPDSSALTRALAALSSPLALSLSLLDLNNSLRARSVRPSLPLERSARSPRTRALSLTLVLSLTLSLALSSLCNSPRSRLVAASSAEVRSRSHAWWAHKVRECIHNKSSQDIHNTPTRTKPNSKA